MCSLHYFLKENTISLKLFQHRRNIEMVARIFVDKMKRFSLKGRLDEGDFENDLEAFFLPVNENVDKVVTIFNNIC